MSIELPMGPFLFEEFRRFDVEIPIIGLSGRVEGMVRLCVIAKSAKQARARARKEMLKIARVSTNKAKIVDTDPKRKDP
jgi:hypothetical protein